jgi:hypothetical protein
MPSNIGHRGASRSPNYFNGRVFAGEQAKEFQLLQQGTADFAIGSIFNWSAQVNELNLFARPSSFRAILLMRYPILFEIFQALGASPVSMNWSAAQNAFRQGKD